MPGKLFLTGGTGFIGFNLLKALPPEFEVTLAIPDNHSRQASGLRVIPLSQTSQERWGEETSVLHFASLSALANERRKQKFNVELTLRLAKKAIDEQAKEFVFLSQAELSYLSLEQIKRNEDLLGKLRAENGLKKLFAGVQGTRLVILRLPQVYGPENRESEYSLFRLAKRRVRLPLAGQAARRSRLFVGNLISALLVILQDRERTGVLSYALSDLAPVSAGEFYQEIWNHYQEGSGLSSWPDWVYRGLIKLLLGLKKIKLEPAFLSAEAVAGFLEERVVDAGGFARDFGWRPPHSWREGVKISCDWFDQLG